MKPSPSPLLRVSTLLLVLSGCASAARGGAADGPTLAITMDDLPVHGALPAGETRESVAARIVAAFRAAGVPEVYGFVNAVHLERDPGTAAALEAWTDAGYPLGNHTWSHPNLDEVGARAFADEILRDEAPLQRHAAGRDWHWFRYPFLAEGGDPARRDSVRAVLAARGYHIAAVTTDFSDWQWSDAYARCRAAEDSAGLATLERAYLDDVRESMRRSRSMARALYGRDVPYVLLSHVSAFNARMMPRVLEVYRREGVRFVRLETAERDAIYRADVDPSQPAGPTSLEARSAARGLPVPPRTDRTDLLASICR